MQCLSFSLPCRSLLFRLRPRAADVDEFLQNVEPEWRALGCGRAGHQETEELAQPARPVFWKVGDIFTDRFSQFVLAGEAEYLGVIGRDEGALLAACVEGGKLPAKRNV